MSKWKTRVGVEVKFDGQCVTVVSETRGLLYVTTEAFNAIFEPADGQETVTVKRETVKRIEGWMANRLLLGYHQKDSDVEEWRAELRSALGTAEKCDHKDQSAIRDEGGSWVRVICNKCMMVKTLSDWTVAKAEATK